MEGDPPDGDPIHTPRKTTDATQKTTVTTTSTKDTSDSPNGRKHRLMFEEMRARYNQLKKSCEENQKMMAEKYQTIIELKTQMEKPSVVKMCNDDPFVPKLRKGANGPTKGCQVSGCDQNDVDLIRCSLCSNLVCEECSGVKISKLRPIMNQCKTLYFSCPGCNLQISDKTTVNAYDVLKEKVQVLTEDLHSCEVTNDKLVQQQRGDDAIHQQKITEIQSLLDKKTKEAVKLESENINLRNEVESGKGVGDEIETI